MNLQQRPLAGSRGISLIEALIALAVMAIGMLGVVGMQTTLRGNSDLAKQRSEAVRYAQEAIEQWRGLSALDSVGGRWAYEDIATPAAAETIAGTNATYTRTRTVTAMDTTAGVATIDTTPRAKSLQVTVSWEDRTGQTQAVALQAMISGVTPELAGTLAVPADGDPVRQPFGRHRGIPPQAVDLGDGRSAFVPPGAGEGVVWVFNNTSALINLCTVPEDDGVAEQVTAANLRCGDNFAVLLTGVARYSLAGAPDAANPTSDQPDALRALSYRVDQSAPFVNTIDCAMDYSVTPPNYTPYYCAVPVRVSNNVVVTGWTGTVSARPADKFASRIADASSGRYMMCRYFANANYSAVTVPLLNQNYLIIADGIPGLAEYTCPGAVPGPTTWAHQPAS